MQDSWVSIVSNKCSFKITKLYSIFVWEIRSRIFPFFQLISSPSSNGRFCCTKLDLRIDHRYDLFFLFLYVYLWRPRPPCWILSKRTGEKNVWMTSSEFFYLYSSSFFLSVIAIESLITCWPDSFCHLAHFFFLSWSDFLWGCHFISKMALSAN